MDESTIDWRDRAAAAEARAEAAEARVAALEKQVADLIARLSKDSSNSHKPPSTDRPGRRKRRKKEGSGRKPGGQPGHKGHHRALKPESEFDRIVPIRADSCSCCGASLAGLPVHGEPMRYQQEELPPIRPIVTEFRAERVKRPCGTVNASPIRRDQTWCTGPRLMATIATLAGRYRLSRDETTALLRDLLGVELSEGTVQAICERVSAAVAAPVEELEAALPNVSQLFLDETGWKERDVRHWLWVAATTLFSVFAVRRRRSSAQVRTWLPDGPGGIVTSDRWSAYSHLDPERRQLCWAHLHRDLRGLVEANPEDAEADLMLRGALKMFRSWRAFKAGEWSRRELQDAVAGFRGCLHRWATKAAQADEKGKRRGLAKDLLKLWPAVFQFIDREGIEPTNNQAERDLRPAVLWRKGSFGTRSGAGSDFVARILSVWATCRKQSIPLIDWVTSALQVAAGLRLTPTLLPA